MEKLDQIMAERKAKKISVESPSRDPTPRSVATEVGGDLDEDTIIVDTGSHRNQSAPSTHKTSITTHPTGTDATAASQEGPSRCSSEFSDDIPLALLFKGVRRKLFPVANSLATPLHPDTDQRAPVAAMVSDGNANPLRNYVWELPGKLGELFDVNELVRLSRDDQHDTYVDLVRVRDTAIRHLQKDIEWVFQREKERWDEY